MPATQIVDPNRRFSPSPYHGSQEGYALLFFGLALLLSAVVLALPWLDIRLLAHDPRSGKHLTLAICTDVLCLTAITRFIQLYRGLSRKIAQGGPLASYLDGVRLTAATTTNSLLFASRRTPYVRSLANQVIFTERSL